MNYQYLVFFCLALLFVFLVRDRWIKKEIKLYFTNLNWWANASDPSPQVRQESVLIWPYHYMFFELWRWNFRRYVVHHEHYDSVAEFVREELRTNSFHRKMEAELREQLEKKLQENLNQSEPKNDNQS